MSIRMRSALATALLVAAVVAALGAVLFATYSGTLGSGDPQLRQLLTVFVVAGASAILLAVVLGWLGGRSASRRVTRLAAWLRAFAGGRGDLSARVPVPRGHTEMVELSTALNDSLKRIEATSRSLEAALTDQRRFVAEAARRLQGPLASMTMSLQVLRRRPDMSPAEREAALTRTLGDVAAMTSLVDGLDLLARMGSGEGLRRGPLPWATFLESAAARGRRLCAPRPMSVDISPGLGTGHGDAEALQEVLRILFANVALHTPPTTTVTFGAARGPDDTTELTVADDGPGVAAAIRERIFEPFVSGDAGRSTGLGLAIARAIVVAHGGTIVAGPSSPRGLRVRVRLPGDGRPPAPRSSGPSVQTLIDE